MRGSLHLPKTRQRRKIRFEVLEERQLLASITVNSAGGGESGGGGSSGDVGGGGGGGGW